MPLPSAADRLSREAPATCCALAPASVCSTPRSGSGSRADSALTLAGTSDGGGVTLPFSAVSTALSIV